MEIVFGDVSLGVAHNGTHYIFAYDKGGLDSLEKDGREYLYRVPYLSFWRATTDNDRGNGFSKRSAMWMGADIFCDVVSFEATIDGTQLTGQDLVAPSNNALLDSPLRHACAMSITFRYSTCTEPKAGVEVTYSIAEGQDGVRVDYSYEGVPGLPELPVCGMRFVLPFRIDSYEWDGLSGETYPDRMYGGRSGHFVQEGCPTCPYAMAQDYGMHMETRCLDMMAGDRHLKVSAVDGGTFNFAVLPASPHELESAWHPVDLPVYRRTYLTIAAAVRGVGGIDSWLSDVGWQYHVDSSMNHRTCFMIS